MLIHYSAHLGRLIEAMWSSLHSRMRSLRRKISVDKAQCLYFQLMKKNFSPTGAHVGLPPLNRGGAPLGVCCRMCMVAVNNPCLVVLLGPSALGPRSCEGPAHPRRRGLRPRLPGAHGARLGLQPSGQRPPVPLLPPQACLVARVILAVGRDPAPRRLSPAPAPAEALRSEGSARPRRPGPAAGPGRRSAALPGVCCHLAAPRGGPAPARAPSDDFVALGAAVGPAPAGGTPGRLGCGPPGPRWVSLPQNRRAE